LPDGAAELVFQVLSERHERGSLIVTTGMRTSEPYYADTLRQHVSLVATMLHGAGYRGKRSAWAVTVSPLVGLVSASGCSASSIFS
jgi:hypothetical protein